MLTLSSLPTEPIVSCLAAPSVSSTDRATFTAHWTAGEKLYVPSCYPTGAGGWILYKPPSARRGRPRPPRFDCWPRRVFARTWHQAHRCQGGCLVAHEGSYEGSYEGSNEEQAKRGFKRGLEGSICHVPRNALPRHQSPTYHRVASGYTWLIVMTRLNIDAQSALRFATSAPGTIRLSPTASLRKNDHGILRDGQGRAPSVRSRLLGGVRHLTMDQFLIYLM